MYAVTSAAPGGPDVLAWTEVPDPEPGPTEVLVDVAATAVNRADLLQRQGHYPPPTGASPYLGLECSGRIAAMGTTVTGWEVGDPVCALLPGGGYATRVAVPAGLLLPVPDRVGLVAAAALPEAACTVWSNVFTIGKLMAGETLLVHGGASGIGIMAIQLAKAHGARVCATARSAKHEALRPFGPDVLVDYETEDFVAAVRDATGGVGANVVLDIMGASYFARNLDVLAPNGRLLVIGLQGGRRTELDLGALMGRQGMVAGTLLRARPLAEKAGIVAAVREHVWPLVSTGAVRPVVHTTLPLTSAAEAHRIVEASEHVGKVVLVNYPPPD